MGDKSLKEVVAMSLKEVVADPTWEHILEGGCSNKRQQQPETLD